MDRFERGIQQVLIKFERETLGIAEYGRSRPDVGNKFPTVTFARKSGFCFRGSLDPAKVSVARAVTVEALLCDGKSRSYELAVKVQNEVEVFVK